MTAEPTLNFVTKMKLSAFATQTAIAHPEYQKTVFTLNDTLEQRLPLDVQNQIIGKLNKDPDGTLAAAKALIDKDPKILEEINKDPLKLATIMGVKTAPTPVAAAPTQEEKAISAPTAATQTTTAPAKATTTAPQATGAQAAPPPKQESAAVAATAPVTISDEELAVRAKLSEEAAKVTAMTGFKEFSDRAQNSQSLTQAMEAMMGQGAAPQDTLKSLQEIQGDPQFFVKANEAIDQIPEQMRDNVFTQIAEDPELGKKALQGDAGAKSSLMMSSMFGGMFGGAGGQGLGGLFSGEGMQGFGEMISNILPKLMEMLSGIFGTLMGGLEKFSQSQGVMRAGNGLKLTGDFGRTIDNNMGTNNSNKPVIDASRPNDPPVAIADLGKGATPSYVPPEVQRKLEQQSGAPGTAIS